MTRDTLRLLDLPWDLVVEILSRVPATSLSPLRFTCKRWNTLFKDQKFIKQQLDKAAKQYMVLMLCDSKVYSMNVNLDGIHDNVVADPQTLLNLKDFHNISQRVDIRNIFHCNGLLLCTTRDFRLVVWNPCTGQIRWIPYSGRYKDHREFSLGYENNKSCQTYKILRCSLDSRGLEHQVRIYDFESHSWKDLTDVVHKDCTIISKRVSFKGNIYWIAKTKYEDHLLLSFDFSTEKFRSIPFPSLDYDCAPTALSVVREERLSVLYRSTFDTPKIEIWMTSHDKIDQTKVVSWSKFLSLELGENSLQKRHSNPTTFFIDEEKKVAVLCELEYRGKRNTNMVYIVGEANLFMKIPVRESRFKFLRKIIYNYVPSLVQIQQGGVMTKEKAGIRTTGKDFSVLNIL